MSGATRGADRTPMVGGRVTASRVAVAVATVMYAAAQVHYHPIKSQDALFVAALATAVVMLAYRLVAALAGRLIS